MHDYQTIQIDKNFTLKVLSDPRGFDLSDVEKDEIESIWNHELREPTHRLFNGQILNVVFYEDQQWIGEFVEYKFYIAQLRNSYFKDILQIRPLGISGLTSAGDKILWGQRSLEVTTYQNFYETVPSGAIDPLSKRGDFIDLKNQIELELFEETGISSTEIKKINCFAIVYDPIYNHFQVCAEIIVNYSIVADILKSTWEYSSLAWVSKNEVKNFLLKNSKKIVPMTQYLLTQCGYIKPS